MDAVRTDQRVAVPRTAAHGNGNSAGVLSEFLHPGGIMQCNGPALPCRLGQHAEQVAAVDMIIGRTVAVAHTPAERRCADQSARLPGPELGPFRQTGALFQGRRQAQIVQHPRTVRAQLDAGADFTRFMSLLEYGGLESGPGQAQGSRQAAYTAPGNQDFLLGHLADDPIPRSVPPSRSARRRWRPPRRLRSRISPLQPLEPVRRDILFPPGAPVDGPAVPAENIVNQFPGNQFVHGHRLLPIPGCGKISSVHHFRARKQTGTLI